MNRQFGALSGLAIIAIILNHSIEMVRSTPEYLRIFTLSDWEQHILTIFQSPGIFGVPIFLFISGCFIAYAASGEPPKLSGKFLWSSLKHILLPYLIWSIIVYVFFYLVHGDRHGILEYVKNLLVGYPFHFIPLLVFYYLISPLLVRIAKKHGYILLALIAAYQIFNLNVIDPNTLGFKFPEWSYNLTLPVLRNTMADWAIYFPLGLVYGLDSKNILQRLQSVKWVIVLLTIFFYVLPLLSEIFRVINFPIAHFLSITLFTLLIPMIKRNSIPFVRFFEKVGRRSYGLYLTHLITIDIIILLIQAFAIWLFNITLVIIPLVFLLGLFIPLLLIELSAQGPTKHYHRIIFG